MVAHSFPWFVCCFECACLFPSAQLLGEQKQPSPWWVSLIGLCWGRVLCIHHAGPVRPGWPLAPAQARKGAMSPLCRFDSPSEAAAVSPPRLTVASIIFSVSTRPMERGSKLPATLCFPSALHSFPDTSYTTTNCPVPLAPQGHKEHARRCKEGLFTTKGAQEHSPDECVWIADQRGDLDHFSPTHRAVHCNSHQPQQYQTVALGQARKQEPFGSHACSCATFWQSGSPRVANCVHRVSNRGFSRLAHGRRGIVHVRGHAIGKYRYQAQPVTPAMPNYRH